MQFLVVTQLITIKTEDEGRELVPSNACYPYIEVFELGEVFLVFYARLRDFLQLRVPYPLF
jgi:hypothetical protein